MSAKPTWTQKEVKYLEENWGNLKCREIAAFLGKKPQACFDKAHQLGLRKREGYGTSSVTSLQDKRKRTIRENFKSSKWTVSQVKFLQENMGKLSDKEISEKLGKTIPAIYCKRRSLKVVKNTRPVPDPVEIKLNNHFKAWTKEEEKFLKENFDLNKLKKLAKELGRTEYAIRTRAYTLGLIHYEERPRTKWTEEEVKYIKKNIKSKSYEEMGEYLGRSSAAIASKASALKISKSPIRKNRRGISIKNILIGTSIILNIGLLAYIFMSLSM